MTMPYYRTLNDTYQQDFASHADRQRNVAGDYQLFWNQLVQNVL